MFSLIFEVLPGDQFRKIFNGTAEERHATIMALDPDKRYKVLANLPQNLVDGLPDLQKEQEAARKKQQEDRQMEMRRLRPPISDFQALSLVLVFSPAHGPVPASPTHPPFRDQRQTQSVTGRVQCPD